MGRMIQGWIFGDDLVQFPQADLVKADCKDCVPLCFKYLHGWRLQTDHSLSFLCELQISKLSEKCSADKMLLQKFVEATEI